MLDGVAVTGSTPVPRSATVCGLPSPLSLTLSVPLRRPRAVGVNVTEIVQLLPAVRVVEQLVLRVKSARFETMLLTLMDVFLAFLSVTIFSELDIART